ncbi:MAG: hypothetical protein IPJ41_00660 [Phycisphaerales bacterium]|nr:hypothetical protein [Phycisphaerales bacterium]
MRQHAEQTAGSAAGCRLALRVLTPAALTCLSRLSLFRGDEFDHLPDRRATADTP